MSGGAERSAGGRRLIRLSWLGTGLFTVTAVSAAAVPDVMEIPALVVALVLFFAGILVFIAAYVVAVARSRTDDVGVASVFLLSGSAAGEVRRHLLGSLALEVVVGLATAAARPFTSLAFGVLAPLYALALAGLWGARHGTFPPRQPQSRRAGRG